jgi:hypothetical protein
LELALHDPAYEPMVHRFGQDFVIAANVLQRTGLGGIGLWNDEEQFYFDVIRHGGERLPLKIYSVVGLVPLFAASIKEPADLAQLPFVTRAVDFILQSREFLKALLPSYVHPGREGRRMLSVVDRDGLVEILRRAATPMSRSASTSAASTTKSAIAPVSRTIGSSAATRTGADRCGFR